MCVIFTQWDRQQVHRDRLSVPFSHIEVIDLNTKNRYRDETKGELRLKCTTIFLLSPIHMFSKMVYNASKFFFDIGYTNFLFAKEIISNLYANRIKNITSKLFNHIKRVVQLTSRDIVNIIRAPFFSLGMQFASFFGIFYPCDGRKFVALIEKKWNYNISTKRDFRYIAEKEKISIFKLFLDSFTKEDSIVYYSARCFQSLGNLNDKSIQFVKSLSVL